ncbi:putative phosphotransferase [Mycobacterium antarcticum]|uniref:phosphotransferase n=1 Tax=Mycolicibacterium sp. TUM20985 TaxID=3023370 RepID=UPI0025732B41|nr:phosphotransferase [Mycolicibacterium sp. TUM20985]BDX29758.1 putative phosphotransferase [Mycolicibacterium sp. TUM20985]
MTVPVTSANVPNVVVELAAGREITAVRVNELGGTTFSLAGEEFVKICGDEQAPLLVAEAQRTSWAIDYRPVPRVLSSGPNWLHTAALPGLSAVGPHWIKRPRTSTRAIAQGLRLLHRSAPIKTCPFGAPSWVPHDAPPADLLVVCHGAALAPNTIVADDAQCSGTIHLAYLGVADRWADLAIATSSIEAHFGPGFDAEFYDEYEIDSDDDRVDYYRQCWARRAGGLR